MAVFEIEEKIRSKGKTDGDINRRFAATPLLRKKDRHGRSPNPADPLSSGSLDLRDGII